MHWPRQSGDRSASVRSGRLSDQDDGDARSGSHSRGSGRARHPTRCGLDGDISVLGTKIQCGARLAGSAAPSGARRPRRPKGRQRKAVVTKRQDHPRRADQGAQVRFSPERARARARSTSRLPTFLRLASNAGRARDHPLRVHGRYKNQTGRALKVRVRRAGTFRRRVPLRRAIVRR